MIDVDLQLSVGDQRRRFDLAVRFATNAPFAALYGPSGAGKSLTLQAIAGLLRPGAGHVRLNGRTLYDGCAGIELAPPQRRIGYLFQNYALFPHLSVRDNVSFGLTSWRHPRVDARERRRVDDLLESFGLRQMADARPAALSGGQQQRVALARALACEPQVLLLDEPLAALSPALRGELRRELADVQRRWNIPVLMITHDIDDVLELADVAFVYAEGRVVRQIDLESGESRDIALQRFGVPPVPAPSPLRLRLRSLLTGGPAAAV